MHFLRRPNDLASKFAALDKSQAIIEFDPEGTILGANENFLSVIGYRLDEIRAKHHSMFVDPAERDSGAYRELWAALKRGEFQSREFKRIAKGGREVWIQASYNPLLNSKGKPFKVVKFATDITAQKLNNVEYEEQIKAIEKSQAVIRFTPDGTILDANENFLKALGYGLKGDPARICTQCHEREDDQLSWQKVHDKHVTDKKYDCSFCHTFTRPERGLRLTRR